MTLPPDCRPCVGFPGYHVTRAGEVWSARGPRRLKQVPSKRDGRYKVTLCGSWGKRQVYIHVLVLEAWVGPRPAGMLGLHYDDNPTNNNVGNLRWGTHADNIADSIRNGHHRSPFTDNPPNPRAADESQAAEVRRMIGEGMTHRRVAKLTGLTKSTVHQIAARKGVYKE